MAVKIFSCFTEGLEASLIEVEVDILAGLPGLSIVGLGDTAVQEAKERIRSAIKNSGADYPQQKKIINLAPAHLRKNGACFDVPMALGLLEASKQIKVPPRTIIVGELALDGEIRPVRGALSMAVFARNHNMDLFIPEANMLEASLTNYPKIYGVKNLGQIISHCRGNGTLKPVQDAKRTFGPRQTGNNIEIDMNMIQGQLQAKRALEIAAAGGHHMLLFGPPGTGKTLLARALRGILPHLTTTEMLEVLQIYSAGGLLASRQNISLQRPFRRIHQTCTIPALIGGAHTPSPVKYHLPITAYCFSTKSPKPADRSSNHSASLSSQEKSPCHGSTTA